jgi:hypothetical protein
MTTRTVGRIGVCIVVATFLAGAAPARATPKQQDIRKLLVLTGSAQLGMQVMSQLMQQFKASRPGVPEKFWEDFMKKVRVDDLIDLIVPIYDKHLQHAEVKDLIKFYETPTGRKLVRVLPLITQESMVAGQRWGMKLGKDVASALKHKGY